LTGIPDNNRAEHYPNEHARYTKQEAFGWRFWACIPLDESRFEMTTRVHQAFDSFQRDNINHAIDNLVVVCHGVTLRAFVMMWCHKTPEWFEKERNPADCSIRILDEGVDQGYGFEGFRS